MSHSGLMLLAAISLAAFAADSVPVAQGVEPRSGAPGTVVKLTGRYLDSAAVTHVYLTDHRFDLMVKVLDQNSESITFRIPPFAKPGRFQVLFSAVTGGKEVLLEQPAYVMVEEGPAVPEPPAPATMTAAPKPSSPGGQAPPTPAAVKPYVPAPSVAMAAALNAAPANPTPEKVAEPSGGAEKIPATPIRVLKQSPPVYPTMAKQLRLAGAVTLQVTVESDGKVSKVDVVDGNPMLATGAVSAVKRWNFEPATVRGQPVQAKTSVVVHFAAP